MENALETYKLSKLFERPQGWRRSTRSQPVAAVSEVSFSVQAGELFGLLGPNGAGKTTLVKMLSTLILPSSGTATVAGHPLAEPGKIRASVGLVVSDERSFYWRLSARRNLDFFAALYGLHGRTATERIDEVLTYVDLLDEANKRFSNFSTGMKQRLAIARGLLHKPRILFLDEPSRSLDPIATGRLHDLLQLMTSEGMTIFLITHDLAEAEKLCHRLALMHQGRIQVTGNPLDLRRQLRPRRHYTITVDGIDIAILNRLRQIVPELQRDLTNEPFSQLQFRAVDGDGLLSAVLDILSQAGLAVHAIEGKPPTLEEVFTHFTTDARE